MYLTNAATMNSHHLRSFCGCKINRQLHLNLVRPQTYPGVPHFHWSDFLKIKNLNGLNALNGRALIDLWFCLSMLFFCTILQMQCDSYTLVTISLIEHFFVCFCVILCQLLCFLVRKLIWFAYGLAVYFF